MAIRRYAQNSAIANVDLTLIASKLRSEGKEAATAIRSRVRKAVKEAAQEGVDRVKAASSWSTGDGDGTPQWKLRNPGRVPIGDAVTTKTSFSAKSASAFVDINSRKAPNARPLEGLFANGTFRHPVFNKRVWVNQPTRPFFFDTLAAIAPDVQKKIEAATDEIARDLGFK